MAEDGVDTLYGFGWHDGSKDRKGTIDRCLVAMKEDVANWLSRILTEEIMVETLMEDLDTGVVLCRLANLIQRTGEEFLLHNCSIPRNSFPPCGVTFKERTAFRGSFIARDNVANFIRWCRELGVPDILMFETEDLVLHKNEKSVILTLMDVARLSVKFGFDPPDLVKMENEIDREIEQQPENVVEMPMARLKKKHKSHSLDDLVYQVLEQCTCPVRYPVLRIAEGKYRVGESKSLIFVRVMRKHVMVRVGGGWDTLERYFDKHDPCKISERQRRNSIKSPRSRSGSDAIGRSPSTMSMSSTDSHDSTGSSVTHGRSASSNPSQGSSSQLKSPREDARRTSPSRSPTPDSPRRTRKGMASRDTPPRTIQTQSRGRLARKSKSMQELSSFVEISRVVPSYSKPTSSSIRKQSQSGPEKSPTGTTGTTGESRRNSSVTSARKTSASPRDASSAKDRLSSSGPVGSQKGPPMRVSRSASFGSRPRPLGPLVEPRARAAVPKGEAQRRTSMASPRKIERSDGPRPREPSATRRSSTTLNDSKGKLPGSPKPAGSKSVSHEKQERNRKPSVTRISSTEPKIESTRKLSKGTPNQANTKKSLPSSPGNRKTSTTQPNVASSAPVKGRAKQDNNAKTTGKGNISKGLIKDNGENEGGNVCSADTNGKHENGMENGMEVKETVEFVDLINGPTYQEDSLPINASLNLEERNMSAEETNDISFTVSVSSADGRYLEISANERKASQGSLETDSDLMSDMLSDFTDTDYDIRSQRYSGLSEASSDVSFGTSSAWRFLHSPDVERNIPEPCRALASPELSSSPKVKDCLTNLNLQGSLTPTMKRRIFNEAPLESLQEGSSESPTNSIPHPVDKAKFFDVEKYKNLSEEHDDAPLGSPRKWSLVKSLISSIENRGVEAGKVSRVNKNTTATRRAGAERASRENQDDPVVAVRNMRNPETMETTHTSSCSFQEQNKGYVSGNGHTTTVMGQRSTGYYEEAITLSDTTSSSHVMHDINSNIRNDLPKLGPEFLPNSQRVPGEKPYEAAFDTSKETVAKTRKISRDKRDRIKDLDVFPRPQRQFTLEEMIQDMMPPDGETKETGEQRVTSPEPRFQAWL